MFKYLRRSRTTSNVQAILDKYFGYTTLLLNGETQSDSFATDASTNSLQISPVGSVRNDLFSPFNGDGNYSVAFNGSTDYFQLPFNSAYVLNSASSFTVECWVNLQSAVASTILSMRDGTGSTAGWEVGTYAANPQIPQISWDGAGKTGLLGTTNIALNTWTHLAFTYDGTTLRYFKNGVMESSATSIVTSSAASQNLFIGLAKYTGTAIRFFPGNISNVRIVKGTAVYTAPFTPSTSGLTAIANTSLLCCQSSSFKDNSTNNFVLTVGGSQKVSPLAPFSYTPAAASGYFGGNGNYLATLSSSSFNVSSTTSVWTAECWVYPVASGYVFSIGNGGTFGNAVYLQWGMSSAQTFTLGQGNGSSANTISIITSANYPANAWYHVAITKDASGVRKVYVNGALAGTQTAAGAGVAVASGLVVNGAYDNNGIGNNGGSAYVSNLRFVNGTAVYTANFTPPTVPLTAITNTALLTLQNAGPANNIGFLDSSVNDLVLTRNGTPTQGTFSPFSQTGWSALFNGTTDWAQVSINSALDLGSGDFTVEFWFNTPVAFSGATTSGFLGKKLSDTTNGWQIYKDSGTPTKMNARIGLTNNFFSATTPTVGVWQHWALVRSGTTVSWYVNGVLDSTTTNSVNVSDTTGAFNVGYADTWAFYGNFGISNLRIVKGTAVYTTNFTPSTTPLTAITNTVLLAFQSNRIVDNSSGALPLVTHAGSPTIQAMSPFEPTSAYSSGNNGGSMYFNGTTDWLTVPDSAQLRMTGTSFTYEAWVYPTAYSAAIMSILGKRATTGGYTGVMLSVNSDGSASFLLGLGGSSWTNLTTTASVIVVPLNQWTHVSGQVGGGIATLAINGITKATAAATTIVYDTAALSIGAGAAAGGQDWSGYISNVRIVNGTQVYQAFNAPTLAYSNSTALGDPYFNQVSLLLHGDGSNGATNKTFLDSSANALAITPTGNPTQGTFTPFSATGWSTYFNGTTDWLATPTSVNNGLGTVFTLEAWIYPTSFAVTNGPMIMDNRTGNECGYWVINTSGLMVTTVTSTSVILTASTALSLNTWSHVAIASDANGMRMYINGSLNASTTTQATWPTTTRAYYIGAAYDASEKFSGSMSNVRVVNGTAVYTAAFTPPTAPLTAVTGTAFLVCQSSRFVDTSSNAVVLAVTGTPSVQANSPFAVTTAYSAAVNGGSMYFNGSTDYLQTPSNALFNFGTSGNFTVEAWIYTTTSLGANWYSILDHADSASSWYGWQFGASNNTFEFSTNSGTTTGLRMAASTTFQPNTWNHLAVVRSGTTFTMFQNGLSVATATSSLNFDQTIALVVGRERQGTYYFPGYVSNSRIVNGTALYTTAFTPPTAPLTAIANTSLLLSGTNGGIVDSTGKNNLSPFGSAQVSIAYTKFGSGSLSFNGTTDYITLPASSSSAMAFGTGNFTIELWAFQTSFSAIACVLDARPNTTQGAYGSLAVNTNGTFYWYVNQAAQVTSNRAITLNTWNHLVVCRNNGTTTLYLNGVSSGSYADAVSYLGGRVLIGGQGYVQGSLGFPGYLDELRITMGVARYNNSFAIPTVPVTAIANTQLLLSGTNPGIANAASSSDLITAGSASTSSVQKKFGSRSLYFNGTTDYLSSPISSAYKFGGDFTVEAWIYPTVFNASNVLFDCRISSASSTGFALSTNSSQQLYAYSGSAAYITTTNTVALNTWSHVAYARKGSTHILYINGVVSATLLSNTTNYTDGNCVVGKTNESASNYFTGYVDDLRVTNGYARYWGGFTVPTQAFGDSTAADPYFSQVSLMVHGDGSSYTSVAQNNNVFLDSSANAFTLIRTGTPTQGTFSPFSPNGWSAYFNGLPSSTTTMPLVCTPASANLMLGGTTSTVECWFNLTSFDSTSLPHGGSTIFCFFGGSGSTHYYAFQVSPTGFLYLIKDHAGALGSVSTTSVALGTWYHIAVVIGASGSNKFYLNGQDVTATFADPTLSGFWPLNFTGSSVQLYAGTSVYGYGSYTYLSPMTGYISNLRVVRGTAVYTSPFTPPTSPLAAITGTVALLLQSNHYVDNSISSFAITAANSVSIQSTSPFAVSTAYSAAANGGSMYFNGSTDRVTSSFSNSLRLGTNNFTIELFAYFNSTASSQRLCGGDNPTGSGDNLNWCVYTSAAGTVNFYLGSTGSTWDIAAATLIGNVIVGQWYHIAIVRNGQTFTPYLNGVAGTPVTSGASLFSSIYGVTLGGQNTTWFSGYLSNFRLVNGTALYTSAFTPPTAPLAIVGNTAALFNGVGSGVIDGTGKNDVVTVGTAKTQSSVVKYGTGALQFNGTTDYLTVPSNAAFAFGTGDFTIEGWMYNATPSAYAGLFSSYPSTGTVPGAAINIRNTGIVEFNIGYVMGSVNVVTSTAAISANTWTHLAAVRSNGSMMLFVNGVLQGTLANSTNISYPSAIVGRYYIDGTSQYFLNGYIDDLRVTNGVARYTANFTAPTSALPNNSTGDAKFNQVALLLQGDLQQISIGINRNNTFLDSSTNNFSLSVSGNPTQGTFSPFSNTGWSGYFNGSTDCITLPANSAYAAGYGDFTIEAWVLVTSSVGGTIFDTMVSTAAGNPNRLAFGVGPSSIGIWSGSAIYTSTSGLSLGVWTHVALTKQSSVISGWINGVQVGTVSNNYNFSDNNLTIGCSGKSGAFGGWFPGYISNLRFVKGTALYTTAFTPSTVPLTAISGTSVLILQNNTFKDNSSLAALATVGSGAPSIQAKSPFAVSTYNPAVNGGSMYFDGASQVSFPTNAAYNLGSGNYTVEFWLYPLTWGSNEHILDGANFEVKVQNSQLSYSGLTTATGNIPPVNQWSHLAFVRTGTSVVWYLNGVPASSGVDATNYSTLGTQIIGNFTSGSYYYNGYLASLRVVPGTAIYTAPFTPSTTPLTAITNTALLLNGTAAISDTSGTGNIVCVGNVNVGSNSKFGGGSLTFNGTTDYAYIPHSPAYVFGTQNFTIECWFNTSSVASFDHGILSKCNAVSNNMAPFAITQNGSNSVMYLSSNGSTWDLASALVIGSIAVNTWYHVALVRNGNTITSYLNGVSGATVTTTAALMANTTPIIIGASNSASVYQFFNGSIDDVRITTGVARYTSNFSVPTASFPTN